MLLCMVSSVLHTSFFRVSWTEYNPLYLSLHLGTHFVRTDLFICAIAVLSFWKERPWCTLAQGAELKCKQQPIPIPKPGRKGGAKQSNGTDVHEDPAEHKQPQEDSI